MANLILILSLLLTPLVSRQITQPEVNPVTASQSSGRVYYVTPTGLPTGDGSAVHPWNLATALDQPAVLKPGDTIYLRGGSYIGSFQAHLHGSASDPITVRAYPGERVILTNNANYVLEILDTHYVNFWGLELAGSQTVRVDNPNQSANGILVDQGKKNPSDHVNFINMIIHDVQGTGIAWWQALTDSEIYGSLIYYNGTNSLDHGVYLHNSSGYKALVNNFIFDNSDHGVHAYAQFAAEGLSGIILQGNTIFDNGSIRKTLDRNILVGGWIPADHPVITNNYTYFPGQFGESLNLGLFSGSNGAQVTDNYFAGGMMEIAGPTHGLQMKNNKVYAPGGLIGFNPSNYPNNDWKTTRPSGTAIFLRKNEFESNRANLTIYNWDNQKTVMVSASTLKSLGIKAGAHYWLHNVQNYYGDVVSGIYNGSAIPVPMTGHTMTQPRGLSGRPDSSFPVMGALVLIFQ